MATSTTLYRQELSYHVGTVFTSAPFDISMRHYFEDFLYQVSRIHEFSKCIFYIDISSKKLERTFVYYDQIRRTHVVERFIRRFNTKHVMTQNMTSNPMIIVDRMLQKIKDLFSDKLTGHDYYEFCVHARLVDAKIHSFSSDLYKLRVDNLGPRLCTQLNEQKIPGLRILAPSRAALSASLVTTTMKKA